MYQLSENDRPYRGKRITWCEFVELTGKPKPEYRAANDNKNQDGENEKAPRRSEGLSIRTAL